MQQDNFYDKLTELLADIQSSRHYGGKLKKNSAWLKQYLNQHPLLSLGRESSKVGHRYYDKIIERLFSSITTGVPREVFLEQVVTELSSSDSGKASGVIFVLEGHKNTYDNTIAYTGLFSRKIKEQRWKNFCQKTLPELNNSRFLELLIFQAQSIEVQHAFYIPDYQNEFSTLIDTRGSDEVDKKNFWINAVALPSGSPHYPGRTLISLYPHTNKFDELLRVPSSANQEWRVLHFAGIAYQQLAHQLAGLAEQVNARRSELLNELAPGILHHELSASLDLMRANLRAQLETANELINNFEHPLLNSLAEETRALISNAERLYRTADTFNNLEQRRGQECIKLSKIVEQVNTICYHRLGATGVHFVFDLNTLNENIDTDAALLLHLITNIIINACNAMQETQETIRHKTIELILHEETKDQITIHILNNGPAIDGSIAQRIFERGFTTRVSGHGQGLYICKMIANYLGGGLELLENKALPKEHNVGFSLTLPTTMPSYRDLDSERNSHD